MRRLIYAVHAKFHIIYLKFLIYYLIDKNVKPKTNSASLVTHACSPALLKCEQGNILNIDLEYKNKAGVIFYSNFLL